MHGPAARQANKDSAGLVYTNKVSIENKEFRDPLLVLGRGDVIAATLPTTKPKNLPFTPKKRFEEEETAQLTRTLTKGCSIENQVANEAWERISICHTSCCLHDEG